MRTNRRLPWLLLSLFLCVILITALPASAKEQENPKKPDKPDKDIIPGQYIVVLRDSVQDPDFSAGEVAKRHRFNLDGVYTKALKGFYARIPDSAVEAVAQDPDVASVEPDRMVYTAQQVLPQVVPTGVMRMGVLQNSFANINGVDDRVNVDIAILDTGIDLDHPDLNVFSSTNCARTLGGCKNGQGNDGHGHGSHVAGIAAALDNDFGVVGVAPGARLWAVKVLDDNGSGYLSWIIKGIDLPCTSKRYLSNSSGT